MYTRVFESILDSSINVQRIPPSARWLWITMMLIADKARTGVVDMPVERLAARAGLTLDQTLEGLAILSAPDHESTSPEEDGRRIVPIREDAARGWRLVNWEKYRKIANEEQQREATRQRVAAFRAKKSGDVTAGNVSLVTCNTSEAEAEAEAASEAVNSSASPDELTEPRKKPKAGREPTAKEAVESFTLGDDHRIWAAQNCPSVPVEVELDAWRDRCRTNGYRTKTGPIKDPAGSWRTSMRNAEAWGTYVKRGGSNGNGTDGRRDYGTGTNATRRDPSKPLRDFKQPKAADVLARLERDGEL